MYLVVLTLLSVYIYSSKTHVDLQKDSHSDTPNPSYSNLRPRNLISSLNLESTSCDHLDTHQ